MHFFCESSLLRINQRHHSLRTRLWHTPPAAVKKPTEENVRERGLGVGVGRDSRYGSIYVCPPSPSRFFYLKHADGMPRPIHTSSKFLLSARSARPPPPLTTKRALRRHTHYQSNRSKRHNFGYHDCFLHPVLVNTPPSSK